MIPGGSRSSEPVVTDQLGVCEATRPAYRIRVSDLHSFLPAIGSVAGDPEHPSKHTPEPLLYVASLDPTGFRQRFLLVEVQHKLDLSWDGSFPERGNGPVVVQLLIELQGDIGTLFRATFHLRGERSDSCTRVADIH